MTDNEEGPKSKPKPRGIRTRHSSQSEGESSSEEDRGKLISSLSQVEVGMRLEANDKYGKWYAAKVVEVDQEEKEVLVHFERWSSRYDELIPISGGRLRQLSEARLKELEKEKEKAKKQLKPDDRIQAKWIDGRMYFGKVLKVHGVEVDLLFDDGVEYTAPVVNVRKRIPDKSPEQNEDSYRLQSVIQGRRQRAEKRKRKGNSSTNTLSSPPSSPLSSPVKKKHLDRGGIFDSDSTGMDSDFLDESNKTRGDSPLQRDRAATVDEHEEKSTLAPLEPTKILHRELQKVTEGQPDSKLSSGQEMVTKPQLPQPSQPPSNSQPSSVAQSSDNPPVTGVVTPGGGGRSLEAPTLTLPSSTTVSNQKPTQSVEAQKAQKAGPKPKKGVASAPGKGKGKDTVATRTRAQTKPKAAERPRRTRKEAKATPTIALDHNEFKCKKASCNKSFRKLSLLESHIKHYHSPPAPPKARVTKTKTPAGARAKAQSPRPSKSPLSPKSTHVPEAKTGKSPESSKKQQPPATETQTTPHIPQAASGPLKTGGPEGTKKHPQSTPARKDLKQMKQLKIEISKRRGDSLSSSGGKVLSISKQLVAPPEGKGVAQEAESQSVSKKQQTPVKEEEGKELRRPSPSSTADPGDDVVHCLCGSEVDEGFMIQCEQCLCWQHGDCIGVRSDSLPKKYICYICRNPPGLRSRLKHKYSRDWYGEGTLPSAPGGPPFPPSLSKAILLSHQVVDSLYKVKKMMHSSEVKLQAASNSNHPYLKQWAKECNHYDKDAILSYLVNQLLPVSYQPQQGDPEAPPTEPEATSIEMEEQKVEQSEGGKVENVAGMESDIVTIEPVRIEDAADKLRAELQTESECGVGTGAKTSEMSVTDPDSKMSDTGTGEMFATGPKTSDTSDAGDSSDTGSKDQVGERRKLRSSTEIQKNAVYHVPKRSKKAKAAGSSPSAGSSGEESTPSSNAEPNKREPSLAPPTQSQTVSASDQPVLVSSPSHFQETSHSHTTPVAAVGTSGICATSQADMMEIITICDNEFGIPEIPVFASTATGFGPQSKLPASSSSVLTSSSSPAIPTPTPSSFCPSPQSAFKPVTPSKPNLTSTTTGTPTLKSKLLPPAVDPLTTDPCSSSSLENTETAPGSLGMQAVTLGEFAEAFLQGDTTNWFRRMKLLDHIETVQDNVQAWLEVIERKLDEIPDDLNMLENYEKLISDVQSTISRLSEVKQEKVT